MSRALLGMLALAFVNGTFAQFPFTRVMDVRVGQQRPAISSIVQDSDGMIWAGSDRGLLRLDGDRVDVVLNLGVARVTALAPVDTGVIVALSTGAVLYCARNRCDTILLDTVLQRSPVRAMAVDGHGRIYVGTYGAGVLVASIRGVSGPSMVEGLPDDHVNDLCLLPNGSVVVATDQGLAVCTEGKVQAVFSEEQGAPDNLVLSVTATLDGGVWAGTDRGGAFLWRLGHARTTDHIGAAACQGPVEGIMELDGMIWIAGSMNGTLLFDQGERNHAYFPSAAALPDARPALDLMADRDGAIWWCDGSDRLYRSDPAVLIIPDHEGVDLKQITALCIDRGKVWFATADGLYSHPTAFRGDARLMKVPLQVDPRTPIVSLDASGDGTIWAATFGSGLFAVHPDGSIDHLDDVHGAIDPNVLSVRAGGGMVWTATLSGMFSVGNGHVEHYEAPGAGFMYMVLPLPDGSVLGATDGNGVVRLDGQRTVPVSTTGPRTYYSLARDSGGTVWAIGPSSGLCRVGDSTMACTGSELPMFNGDVFALATVAHRVLVFSSAGCDAYDPSTGRWTDLTSRSGLEDLQAELNAVCQSPEGALWLACNKGLVRMHALDHWYAPKLSTVITDVLVGSTHVPIRAEWRTTHDRNGISFRFTAPYYADPGAVRFEFRLSGLNDRTVRTREREVSYPALAPGRYTFQVRAFLGEDATGAEWTSMRIQVDPPWWLTWWAITLAVSLFILLTIWAVRTRDQRLRFRQRMEQEQVRFQLEALRSQVDPHFLFNSFNTLMELIESEPDKAVRQVEDLSMFFRNILQVRDKTFIPLADELRLVRTYFGLEQRRFGEAITLEVSVPEVDQRMSVVPLTLQLLVENAIKHNVATIEAPVRISISSTAGFLVVANSLRPRRSPARSTGFGLDSIRKRYAALSPRPVEVERTETNFVVRIPLVPTGT
ncbi:MAG: histidine kinase [Flavobacteriales bacterium]|jgi:ligand-binding sensor domain-containing protein|nr:histidine kinase [Flavobacteriales bacterium]MCB0758817.1 histidine kinase [Flavobacteriales bacterium]